MDNYLDGGYHVSFLHKDLASGLDINSYRLIFSGPFFKTISLNLPISKIWKYDDTSKYFIEYISIIFLDRFKFLFKSHVLENIDLYRTEVGDRFSMQKVKGDQDSDQSDRLAGNSVYAYLYPNMMINRYGPWMDTNIVVPKGKVHIFWEGHKILQNLPLTFDCMYCSQK